MDSDGGRPAVGIDWSGWQQRWDLQQGSYVPDREKTFELILGVVERIVGRPRRLLDLGCGPGSLAARAIRRFPATAVIGVDLDPFLLELARRTISADRSEFGEVDLGEPGWDVVLGDEPLDAVCATSAVHCLRPEDVAPLAEVLARRLRAGGVFVCVDTLRLGPTERPLLDQVAVGLREHLWGAVEPGEPQPWAQWWQEARAEAGFAELISRRDRKFAGIPARQGEVTLAMTLDAFERAGFAEVGVLGQTADNHVLAAVR